MNTFTPRKIYVASSWRNGLQPETVSLLRLAGHEVYDFRNPRPGQHGFGWREIDGGWKSWSLEQYRAALSHPISAAAFKSDFDAMAWADTCVLVLPCGRSAHLEAGHFAGAGKDLFVLLFDGEPELMYLMAARLCIGFGELIDATGHKED